jgi:DNA-binding transcriptional MocR family regulator
LSRFYAETPSEQGLLLGFAGFRPEALREATKRLGTILNDHAATPARAVAGE